MFDHNFTMAQSQQKLKDEIDPPLSHLPHQQLLQLQLHRLNHFSSPIISHDPLPNRIIFASNPLPQICREPCRGLISRSSPTKILEPIIIISLAAKQLDRPEPPTTLSPLPNDDDGKAVVVKCLNVHGGFDGWCCGCGDQRNSERVVWWEKERFFN
ncbi:hypothetical protein D8674_034330 [Pyrus ussuriensis x Pyrus communis]|uniref:Uncharacterized protein n=1 Tax=Pyrus ussuriensis x Pyrus communis TaxID=2448454 RepID=A0A5N5HNY3_9ROSA|nr:hypothetical protein D8674_034330 [Pyrus ussuriensis x Pyrus communis]